MSSTKRSVVIGFAVLLAGCGPGQGNRVSTVSEQNEAIQTQIASNSSQSTEAPSASKIKVFEREIFRLLNDERTRHGVPRVTLSKSLSQVARNHSHDMAQTGRVAHDSRTTGSPEDRVRAAKFEFSWLAENVGAGMSPAALHTGWMNSPGHRQNLLHPKAEQVGIGVVRGTKEGVTVLFATQLFAARPLEIDAKQFAKQMVETANKERKKRHLPPLKQDRNLMKKAKESVRSCFEGTNLSPRGIKWDQGPVTARLYKMQGEAAASAEQIAPMLEKEVAAVGIHAIQGTDPEWGAGTLCVILFLGAASGAPSRKPIDR